MEYLTTHDLVWINNIVTGKVNPYDYVTLEAAMAGQYRYGDSHDTLEQAATMTQRLLYKAPFASGNRRTAFIALLTFLNGNGFATRTSDAESAALLLATAEGRKTPLEAINAIAAPAQAGLSGMTLRKLITHECNLHVEALQILTQGDE